MRRITQTVLFLLVFQRHSECTRHEYEIKKERSFRKEKNYNNINNLNTEKVTAMILMSTDAAVENDICQSWISWTSQESRRKSPQVSTDIQFNISRALTNLGLKYFRDFCRIDEFAHSMSNRRKIFYWAWHQGDCNGIKAVLFK